LFLMGADSLRDLPTWKEPARLCQLATPVIVCRGGGESSTAQADLLDWRVLEGLIDGDRLEAIRKQQVRMARIDLSSSDIRQRVAAGQSIRYRTPRAVEKYIETQGLYRSSPPAAADSL
jgi:nicotinate-nucleotide adenylyltransferase